MLQAIRIGERGRPVVADVVSVVDERDEAPSAVPCIVIVVTIILLLLLLPAAVDEHGRVPRQVARLCGPRGEPVPRDPAVDPAAHGGEAEAAARAARVRDRRVVAAVECQERDLPAAGVARGEERRRRPRAAAAADAAADSDAAVVRADAVPRGVVVVRARDGGEGGDAARRRGVAGEHGREPAALRLARGVDAGRVDAQVGLDGVEDGHEVRDVVDARRQARVPLPEPVLPPFFAGAGARVRGRVRGCRLPVHDDVVRVEGRVGQAVEVRLPGGGAARAVQRDDQRRRRRRVVRRRHPDRVQAPATAVAGGAGQRKRPVRHRVGRQGRRFPASRAWPFSSATATTTAAAVAAVTVSPW